VNAEAWMQGFALVRLISINPKMSSDVDIVQASQVLTHQTYTFFFLYEPNFVDRGIVML